MVSCSKKDREGCLGLFLSKQLLCSHILHLNVIIPGQNERICSKCPSIFTPFPEPLPLHHYHDSAGWLHWCWHCADWNHRKDCLRKINSFTSAQCALCSTTWLLRSVSHLRWWSSASTWNFSFLKCIMTKSLQIAGQGRRRTANFLFGS